MRSGHHVVTDTATAVLLLHQGVAVELEPHLTTRTLATAGKENAGLGLVQPQQPERERSVH